MMHLLALAALLAPAQDKPKPKPSRDYGPFLSASFILKPGAKFDNGSGHFDGPVVARGIAVRFADDWSAGAIFDCDTLRWAAGWTGGPLKFTGVIFDGAHGPSPTLTVPPAFLAPEGPGWAKEGRFDDPRADSIPPLPRPGPLPADWAKYRGLYVHGAQVIFTYTVGKAEVLDRMTLEDGRFVRTLWVGPSDVELKSHDHSIPARPAPIVIGGADLSTLTKGAPGRYPEVVETKGVVSAEPGPYVVDRLTLPEKPRVPRVGGFDFFADGTRAALCTWDGDVWVVSGIDASLEKLKWRRFAAGLHQPLGLRIVDDKVYTVGHDQITRLHDLDLDGEADFYECFNNDWELTTAFHVFCFDLHTDAEGSFYFAFNAPVRSGGGGFHKITKDHGTIIKVSKDGARKETYATGFRANNGIGVGPNGEVTSGDNEGSWVPKCPIHWVKPGSFNGVVDAAHREKAGIAEPKPICWLPKNVDNSGGGQAWVTSDRWGPFQGELLHLSYGTSSLYKVLMEEVGGQKQGGVVKFPVKFTSSAMRARFNPKDGQLYVAGLRGWQTNAGRDGGFDRVRYTGAPVLMPTGLKATKKGVSITFTAPVDPETAKDPERYAVEVWNYKWTSGYGSGEYSTLGGEAKKKGEGHDPLPVAGVTLSDDGKTVHLELPGIKPVHQMRIQLKLKGLSTEIHSTIHALGGE
jgi:hypothetical protein